MISEGSCSSCASFWSMNISKDRVASDGNAADASFSAVLMFSLEPRPKKPILKIDGSQVLVKYTV